MGKTNTYAHKVKFWESEVIYSPEKPLSCGAKVWIETTSPILLNEDKEGKWVYMKGGGLTYINRCYINSMVTNMTIYNFNIATWQT